MMRDTTIPNYPRISHTLPPPRTFAPPPKAKEFDLERALRELAADPVARSLWPEEPETLKVKPPATARGACGFCGKRIDASHSQRMYCSQRCRDSHRNCLRREQRRLKREQEATDAA